MKVSSCIIRRIYMRLPVVYAFDEYGVMRADGARVMKEGAVE